MSPADALDAIEKKPAAKSMALRRIVFPLGSPAASSRGSFE
jgi:hypothetical protein